MVRVFAKKSFGESYPVAAGLSFFQHSVRNRGGTVQTRKFAVILKRGLGIMKGNSPIFLVVALNRGYLNADLQCL